MAPGRSPGGPDRSRAAADRGQTRLDFVVGITVFLVALLFVLAFLPEILAPYEEQETPLVADRAASDLTGTLLVGRERGTLDANCTTAFFAGAGGAGCPFDPTASLTARLGVDSYYRVNVTLRRNVSGDADRELLCSDGSGAPCSGNATAYAAGPAVPDTDRSVAAARRTVRLDGNATVLEVRVW